MLEKHTHNSIRGGTVIYDSDAVIDADDAIYRYVDDDETKELNLHSQSQQLLLRRLLDLLYRAQCLSARGRVLRAWICVNGGAPLISQTGEITRIMNFMHLSQQQHVSYHLDKLTQCPELARLFIYVKRRSPSRTHARIHTRTRDK